MSIPQYKIGGRYRIVSVSEHSCLYGLEEHYLGQLVEVVNLEVSYSRGCEQMVRVKFLDPSEYILQSHGKSTPAYFDLGLEPEQDLESTEALRAWVAYDQEEDA